MLPHNLLSMKYICMTKLRTNCQIISEDDSYNSEVYLETVGVDFYIVALGALKAQICCIKDEK